MEDKGYIYILTNPSFPDYVKLGYATDVESRLKQLNRSECIPFSFRVYAIYEVPSALSDKKLHAIIDRLNPSLRSIETIDGKRRVREFYAMTKLDAYALLEAIAEMHDAKDKLKLIEPSASDVSDEIIATDIEDEINERKENFSFAKCGIMAGEIVEYIHDSKIKCIVLDSRNIEYYGEKYSMSKLAKELLKRSSKVQGTLHFSYKGEILCNMRTRLEAEGKYN